MARSSRSERKTARRGSRTSRDRFAGYFFWPFGATGAGFGGSIALSGKRFHIWLRPRNSKRR